MTPSLLSCHGLVAGYEAPLVGPVDLAVARGEAVGLAGPNGAGKSTLLAGIAGTATVFAGEIRRAPGMRLVVQTQHLPPLKGLPLSGRDLLRLTGASPAGLPPWLVDRVDQRLDRLSGGQRQYLALWAVLAAPADVVILDEPTNNLDPQGADHLAEALCQQVSGGLGAIVVSHDGEFLARVCQRIHHLPPLPSPLS